MRKCTVYYFLHGERRDHVIRKWLKDEGVPIQQIATFQDKLDSLEQDGPEALPGFITDTPIATGIYKMKIKGNKGFKQLRPMCCRGPFGPNEYTILLGVVEKDRKFDPRD